MFPSIFLAKTKHMRPWPRNDASTSETPRERPNSALSPPKSQPLPRFLSSSSSNPAMAIRLPAHAFAGNPLRSLRDAAPDHSPAAALEALRSHLLSGAGAESSHRVLAFRKGRPLVRSSSEPSPSSAPPRWSLGFASPAEFKGFSPDSFVYLGSGLDGEADALYWAVDVSADADEFRLGRGGAGDGLCFVELRTLMIAANWNDSCVMGELAIAGHARAILEWHGTSRFCGSCGTPTSCIDAGRRKQCTNESCKKRIYPRVDPVVIMLVIDKENDRALLSRQSRFVPRMWSCLAGFIEPGESLEEAVRRETWEETGIEVGEVAYHSSQPWPVGPSSMPCQLMVGFFAYAKSFHIRVDKKELEDAQWHSREDVKKALTFAEYDKAQRTSAFKVNQMCKGIEKGQNFPSDFDVESGELAPMFIPGPFAIAHHLISSWVHGNVASGPESPLRQLNSLSNL